jgi:signal transduction histidine kinase/ActR/RegA family two-component response regulator
MPSRTGEGELAALRAELEALRKKLEFFQGAVDSLPFPMFWKDARSVYMGSNQHQARRAGLAAGAAIEGLSDEDLPWTADETASFRADDQDVIVSGEPSSEIIETQRLADDAERLCQTHKAPLRDAEGNIVGVVGWYVDITEREAQQRAQAKLDERLRQAHKLDSLGSLAGGIAHDFNNILAAIVANLMLAQEELGPGHAAADYLADIDDAAARATALVNQILAMSQPRAQLLGPVSLGEVALEASRLLRATIPAGIEVVTNVEQATPMIAADPTQLHQVVINLCTNALFALEDRPSSSARIEITVAGQTLDASAADALPGSLAPGDYVTLTVGDSGVGMDAATKARAFEPFFTTRVVGQGTGLGLSVVHGIIAAHGGAISIHTAPGRGTTVRAYFPQAPQDEQEATPGASAQPDSSPPRVTSAHLLYVDDEVVLVKAIARLFRRDGYRVTTFTDPREALEALRARDVHVDVLAVDFNMPNLSGLDVAREALALCPGLPVIIASGFVTEELRRQASQLGVARVLSKADLAIELPRAVRELTAHQQSDSNPQE